MREKAAKGESFRDHIVEVEGPPGTMHYSSVRAIPQFNTGGRFIGYLGAVADVTETQKVARERGQLFALLEFASDMIWMADLDFKLLYVNKACRDKMGLGSDDQVENWPLDLLALELSEQAIIREQMIPGLIKEGYWRDQITLTFPYVGPRIIESVAFAIRNSSGDSVIAYGGIGRDMTEQKEQDALLDRAQRMDTIGQLTGGVAHDFNNVLQAMLGNLQLVSEDTPEGSAVRKSIDNAIRAGFRGADMTRRLLAFSRQQPLSPTTCDVNSLIEDSTKLMERTIGANIQIVTDLAPDLRSAEIDPAQLESALLNLAVNARDAMLEGGQIKIRTQNITISDVDELKDPDAKPGDYVLVVIQDTGTGMAAETLDHVFEPFFTTKEQGKGTGLGLSMVYGFTHQSGGWVDIDSTLGEGTTVQLYLPATAAEAEPSTETSHGVVEPGDGETILVIEDDPDVLAFVMALLTSEGYVVTTAMDGEEAIGIVESRQHFDLIMTDVVLPGSLNGYQIAEILTEKQPGIRILLTSGYAAQALPETGESTVAFEFIAKPYSKADLLRLIRKMLDTPIDTPASVA